MNKLMMVAIGMVACSMVTGCMSSAVTKGGSYANLPDPKPDEYQIHWENEDNIIEYDAATRCGKIAVRLDGRDVTAARKWALENIAELATGKMLRMSSGSRHRRGHLSRLATSA